MRHSEPNGEFGYAGVREGFLPTPLTVETLRRFRIMQQRLKSHKLPLDLTERSVYIGQYGE